MSAVIVLNIDGALVLLGCREKYRRKEQEDSERNRIGT